MNKLDSKNTYVAIMAGGVGSRFWPASRNDHPKQFLDMLGMGKSLLRLTYERFLKVCPNENIFVVTNLQYRDLVLEHIPEIQPQQVLCEPSRNNTAPCIAYASMKFHQLDPEASMIVAPSDHLITDESAFISCIQEAVAYAQAEKKLLTLGIQPHSPHTGYGYIRYEKPALKGAVHKVLAFAEKPALEKAEAFLSSGDYLWNAGIFVWQTKSILEAFENYAPEIFQILEAGKDHYNAESEQAFINEAYPRTPSISVDYAIMEKAQNVCTIPSEFGWSDLGSWNAVYDLQPKDEQENVINTPSSIMDDSRNCLVQSGAEKLVVIKGLEDYIIIDNKDVLLVYPRTDEQNIKKISAQLKAKGLDQFL